MLIFLFACVENGNVAQLFVKFEISFYCGYVSYLKTCSRNLRVHKLAFIHKYTELVTRK